MMIRLAKENEAAEVAQIHNQEIQRGFLSSLPVSFLQRLYEDVIRSSVGFCIVAEEDGAIVGFAAGTTNLASFYRYFLSHSFLYACFILLPKIRNIKKIFEVLSYPKKENKLPQAELLTIATKRAHQGKGIGVQMMQQFIKEMKGRGVSVFKVMVGKELESAVRFYEKAGFEFFSETSVHEDQPSLILTYHID